MKQLSFDFWWHDSEIWRERNLVSTVMRPCEDEALRNIYSDSRMLGTGNIAPVLSGLERRVYTLELRSMQELPKWYKPSDRHMWIAKQARIPIFEIKNILDNVSYVLRGLDTYERVMLAIDAEELDFRNAVKEVMTDKYKKAI